MLTESSRFAARCLGVPLGKLEVGAEADLVMTNYCPATPLSAENLAGHLIFALGSEYVQHVMVGGEWCLRDRCVVTCDELTIRSRAVQVTRELHERMADL